jgi:hypothetical protein
MSKNTPLTKTRHAFDPQFKQCKKCRKWKLLIRFTYHSDTEEYENICIKCTSNIFVYLPKSKQKQDYKQLFDQQGGVCAICGNPEVFRSKYGNIKKLAKDHDHTTGIIRGLLCQRCNLLLNRFNNIEFFEKIVAYLKKFQPANNES